MGPARVARRLRPRTRAAGGHVALLFLVRRRRDPAVRRARSREALVAGGRGVRHRASSSWCSGWRRWRREAPELLVAGLFAWRLNTNAALGALVSLEGEPVDAAGRHAADRVRDLSRAACTGCRSTRSQREELFLTAAQSFFAVAVLSNLSHVGARGVVAVRPVLGAVPSASAFAGVHLHEEVLVLDLGRLSGRGRVAAACAHGMSSGRCCATGSGRRTARWSRPTAAPPRSLGAWSRRRSSTGSPPTRPRPSRLVHVRELPARRAHGAAVPRRPARAARPPAGAARHHRALPAPGRGARGGRAPDATSCIATGTASGKTLVYNVAFAEAALTDAEGDGAVPVPDEGAGARPAARGARAQAPAGAGRRSTTATRRRPSAR